MVVNLLGETSARTRQVVRIVPGKESRTLAGIFAKGESASGVSELHLAEFSMYLKTRSLAVVRK